MYYPLSQIQSNLYTNGQEYIVKSNNNNYVGFYWKSSAGKLFTGRTPQDPPNLELIPYTSNRSQETPTIAPLVLEVALAYDAPYIGEDPDLYNETEILNYLKLKNISTTLPPITIIPTYSPTIPTQQDYQIGEFRRYFCKKINEIIYIEINKDIYDKLISKDSTVTFQYYQPFNIPWQLTGNKEQVFTTNRNIVALTIKNQKLPQFDKYLKKDYIKYYR
jgi:hypothetical protein